ncbi:Ogfr, partial [Symbiodinium sp. KB8]
VDAQQIFHAIKSYVEAAVLHLAVVYGFWPESFYKKRGSKSVVRDWCDLQGSRLKLLGSYLIRLSQRLPEVQVLKRLLFTVRGISLELVDCEPAPDMEEVEVLDMAENDRADEAEVLSVGSGSDSDDDLEMVSEMKADKPVGVEEKLKTKLEVPGKSSSSAGGSGTVGTFKDRDPLFAKGSYLVFDATEAEALHAEGMEAEGVDVRDMQRKLRASCREDKAVSTLKTAAKKSKDTKLMAAIEAHAASKDEPKLHPPHADHELQANKDEPDLHPPHADHELQANKDEPDLHPPAAEATQDEPDLHPPAAEATQDEPDLHPPAAEATNHDPYDARSPVGSPVASPLASQTGSVEPPPMVSPEPTPRYHRVDPMLSGSPLSTPFRATGGLDPDLSPVATPYKQTQDCLPLPKDLMEDFAESVQPASMVQQSPLKSALQQEPASSSCGPEESQIVVSDWLSQDLWQQVPDEQDDLFDTEDDGVPAIEDDGVPAVGDDGTGEAPKRKERASTSTPAKPNLKKSKRMAREAKSEEAWAEIQALAVAEIPDVIPPRGKKQGRMILVGR